MTQLRRWPVVPPLVFAAHVLCLLIGTHAASVLQAYRLVQYDRDGVGAGTRAVRLSQYATLKKDGATLFRNIVVLPFKDATLSVVKEILDPAAGVAGLVFVLPKEDSPLRFLEDVELDVFLELERFLLQGAISIPVYFVEESPELDEIVLSVEQGIEVGKPPSNVNGGYLLQIKNSGGMPMKQPIVTNYEGWLSASEGGKGGRSAAPTVMVTARYDDFSLVPGKPEGGNISGVVAVLALMRLFGSLYKNPATRPSVNLLFLLTGGGGMNFMGLQHWIATTETRIQDSIEFVIALDTLSGLLTDQELHFHFSKPPKDPAVAEWYGRFEKATALEEVTLHMTHKKINLARPYMAWDHEHLAQHRLLGATLSGLKEGSDPMFRSTLLNRPQAVDLEVLSKAIRLVGNAISMRLYEEEGRSFPLFANISRALPGLEPHFLAKWTSSMGQLRKMAPYIEEGDPFGSALVRFLRRHGDRGSAVPFKMQGTFVFYDGTSAEMGVHKTAGVLLDLLLLVSVLSYLMLLFAGLKIATQGWRALFALFKPPQQKWKRGSSSGRSVAHRIVGSGKK